MPPYNQSVFVNCPFDSDYTPLFRALVFAVHDCGFVARTAWEVDDTGTPRISQLYDLIETSQYGVHDLSRVELNTNDLPRFNMPLELGIFLGAQQFGDERQQSKVCKVFDAEPYRYQEFISDIAGQDPAAHDGDPDVLITQVRNWLQIQKDDPYIPSGSIIAKRYRSFQSDLPVLCRALKLDVNDLTFLDFRHIVDRWLRKNAP